MAIFQPLRHSWPERTITLPILLGLALLAAAAWAVTLWQSHESDALMMAGVPTSLGMGSRFILAGASAFLVIWLAMMAAMMFPSVWPAVLLYAVAARKRGRGSALLFVAGYLLAWEGFGMVAYAGYVGAGVVLSSSAGLMARLPLLTGIFVVLAGLYQFTPLKKVCLAHCQGPLEYLLLHWREGARGALRMGLGHGSYCLGCCWGLMVALLALGLMDLRWMVTVAAAIAFEKIGPRHPAIPRAVGIGLVIVGVAVAAWPPQ
jgi:predicted metal-binding membrane protein